MADRFLFVPVCLALFSVVGCAERVAEKVFVSIDALTDAERRGWLHNRPVIVRGELVRDGESFVLRDGDSNITVRTASEESMKNCIEANAENTVEILGIFSANNNSLVEIAYVDIYPFDMSYECFDEGAYSSYAD